MKKRNIVFVLSLIIAAVFLAACSVNTGEESRAKEQEKEDMTNKYNEIVTLIKNKDKQGLKDSFSSYVKENDSSLEKEIEKAVNSIDGNITDNGEPKITVTGDDDNKRYNVYSSDVETDTGKKYKISIKGVINSKKEPEKKGLSSVTIVDTSSELDKSKSNNSNGIYHIGSKE